MTRYSNPQLAGAEDLEGTYPFDLRASYRAYRVNRFLWRFTDPEWRQRFTADSEQLMEEAGLTEEERDLLRRQDWIGLIRYGVSFFVLEKLARVVKLSNLEVYAAMRGETLEEFLKTRRVPEAR